MACSCQPRLREKAIDSTFRLDLCARSLFDNKRM